MAGGFHIKVTGARELIRAADRADKETKRFVRGRLREVAKPVLQESRRKLARYDARSAARLGISVRRTGTVSVEQRMKRTTGAHPEFGSLQQHRILEPTLQENSMRVMQEFDKAIAEIVDHFD